MDRQGMERRNRQLAEFLYSRRARLSPEEAGLAPGGRRRTPGLRRTEVAQLAGVSVDWYTWLEQGRSIQVSAQVLDSIARALQLQESEREHLFLLASGRRPPGAFAPLEDVSGLVQNFLERQGECPAYVLNLRCDVVAWNRSAALVFGDYGAMDRWERNSVWRLFTSPYARMLLGEGWEDSARHRLAQFRAGYGKTPEDPWWDGMVRELSQASAEFRAWWPRHDVVHASEGRKALVHPTAGPLYFDHLTFRAADAAELMITVNLPRDSATADRMKALMNGGA